MNAKALCNIWHNGRVIGAGEVFECSEAVARQMAGLNLIELIEFDAPAHVSEILEPVASEAATSLATARPKKKAKK